MGDSVINFASGVPDRQSGRVIGFENSRINFRALEGNICTFLQISFGSILMFKCQHVTPK